MVKENYHIEYTHSFPFRTSLETLKQDVTKLDGQINKIQTQMKNPNTTADVKNQMKEFLPVYVLRNVISLRNLSTLLYRLF